MCDNLLCKRLDKAHTSRSDMCKQEEAVTMKFKARFMLGDANKKVKFSIMEIS